MSMKEAKKSALMGLIKSMNKKRHTPKPAVAVDEEEDPAEEAAESPEDEAHEMELGHEDDEEGQEPGMEDMVKGFMKRGRERMPSAKPHGASLTVIMAGSGKRKK